ncbi:hypothetical protein CMALT430_250004 [Carnobacterium maltaromaticum]|nr:hypothetical protein CMALT430_250004 [Carnobacterium maltaromaticum]
MVWLILLELFFLGEFRSLVVENNIKVVKFGRKLAGNSTRNETIVV